MDSDTYLMDAAATANPKVILQALVYQIAADAEATKSTRERVSLYRLMDRVAEHLHAIEREEAAARAKEEYVDPLAELTRGLLPGD